MGGELRSIEGRNFIGFQGIPYAEPPIGKLRFKPPVPIKPWLGVKDVTKPHVICLQKDIYLNTGVAGDEDCLFLNVYKPIMERRNDSLPVMVYFHGGSLLSGSGNYEWYSPTILLDQNIVLVTVNYRLGPLGFLSTGDEACPGNNGLKDQALALKWVNRNIEYFGGNPNCVTIFGQSAGGLSVHLHMFSPLSRGLFHRAISQSGTGFNVWATVSTKKIVGNTQKVAKSVNCSRSTNDEMMKCLRSTDPAKYLSDDLFSEWGKHPTMPFAAVVEPLLPGGFLVENLEKSLDEGKFNEVPWLVGFTKDEGVFITSNFLENPKDLNELNENFNKINSIFCCREEIGDLELIKQEMRKFYFDGETITLERDFKNLTDMMTDALMSSSIDLAIRRHLKVSKVPIYSYLFAYEAGVSFSQFMGHTIVEGVCHVDDLRYLFPIANKVPLYKNVTEKDKEVKNLMTTLWVNFAREGNPTPKNTESDIAEWRATQSDAIEYFLIDGPNPRMESEWLGDRMRLWRSLLSDTETASCKQEL